MALSTDTVNKAKTVYLTAKNYSGYSKPVLELITSQAIHESNGFTSKLFKRSNNAFGMTVAKVRPHTYQNGSDAKQPDGNANYAYFDSLENSVKDMVDYLKYNHLNEGLHNTPDAYVKFLKSKGYYGDTVQNYYNGVNRALQLIRPALVFPVFVPLVFFCVLFLIGK